MTTMIKTKSFRDEYKKKKSYILSGKVYFLLVIVGSLFFSIFSLFFINNLKPLELLIIPMALIVSNFVEYSFHRWPMHKRFSILKKMYKTHSGQHHRYFTNEYMDIECDEDRREVFAKWFTVFLLIFLIVLPTSIFCLLLISHNIGILLFATCIMYYGIYESIHCIAHHPDNHFLLKIPFMKWAKKHHKLHHNTKLMRNYNFNIGLPIMDIIFKTLKK